MSTSEGDALLDLLHAASGDGVISTPTSAIATQTMGTSEGDALLYLLQAATSAFPTGAFSHSYGFETLIDDGTISDEVSLDRLARLWLRYGVATADAAVCAWAWLAADAGDDNLLAVLDEQLGALRITRETRQASLSTGRAFMNAARDAFGGERLAHYRELVGAGACTGHYATAFGVAAHDAGIARHGATLAFLHGSLSSVVGVAARIIPLGQISTQRIVSNARPLIVECARIALGTGLTDLGTSTGWFDQASMAHERVYSRLCIS